jgi:hypothetical protein
MVNVFDGLVLFAFEPACAWMAGKGVSAYRVAQRAVLGTGALGVASVVAECALLGRIDFTLVSPAVLFIAGTPMFAAVLSHLAKAHEDATMIYAGRRVTEVGLGLPLNNAVTIIYMVVTPRCPGNIG